MRALAWWRCGFREPRLEQAWQQRFCGDQAALDSAISLQALLFPSMVARMVRATQAGGLPLL